MKTILVPTDFSANAEHAAGFAVELIKKMYGKIVLFHSYTIPVYATDVPIAIPSEHELKHDAVVALNKLRSKLAAKYPEADFHCKSAQGFITEKVVEEEKNLKVDFVVMGTRGAGGLKELLIGSNTAAVIEKSVCPVIAVPESAQWKGMKKIVFAANYAVDDFKNLETVIIFAKVFNAELVLLHIEENATFKAFDFTQFEGFKMQVQKENSYEKISAKLMEDMDVAEGINRYVEEINADMLVVSMRHRPLIKRLFNRSLTRRLAHHTHVPLLALHTEE